jgi:RNA recognition motif-containing protein
MASKLFVGSLPYSATSEDLRTLFAQYGTVESSTVITDRSTGQSRGFGFVEMASEPEAQAAITKLNGSSFEGRRLTVNVANAPEQGGGSRFGKGSGGGARRPVRW